MILRGNDFELYSSFVKLFSDNFFVKTPWQFVTESVMKNDADFYYNNSGFISPEDGISKHGVSTLNNSISYMSGNNLSVTTSEANVPDQLGSTGVGVQAFPGKSIIIPLYLLIFFLSIIGNLLVILTLARNRRMRTVTNVFLLNLAVSDLLLGVFCMPFTLVGQILRNFIFGHFMCMIIPYFQAVSVSVGVWTLCLLSFERYSAICKPLQSRKWQTRSHAYKMILAVWIISLTLNIPITFVSELQPIRNTGRHKCREIWPNLGIEKLFTLTLDFLLLLLPLGIMGLAYSLIVSKLWKGLRNEILNTQNFNLQGSPGIPSRHSMELSNHSHYSVGNNPGIRISKSDCMSNEIVTLRHGGKGIVVSWKRTNNIEGTEEQTNPNLDSSSCPALSDHAMGSTCQFQTNRNNHLKRTGANRIKKTNTYKMTNSTSNRALPTRGLKFSKAVRSTYTGKSIESKKKVIRMLFVLVLEFLITATPLYCVNTLYLYFPQAIYETLGPFWVMIIQLLFYTSSCCNPITYCFMNRKFRQAFLKLFQCVIARRKAGPPTIGRGSDLSANDSLIYGIQGSTMNKSEVVVVEDHRV